jgi:hypothetical protein
MRLVVASLAIGCNPFYFNRRQKHKNNPAPRFMDDFAADKVQDLRFKE